MIDVKGYFKIATLKKLNEKEHTGYDLIKSLEKVFDRKPSAGSIYPMLKNFLQEGYVTMQQYGRKKKYSITVEGKKALKTLREEKEHLMQKSAEIMKQFENFSGREKVESFNKMIEEMKIKSELLMKDMDVWTDMKNAMLKLVARDNYKQKRIRARKILQETAIKLINLEKGC